MWGPEHVKLKNASRFSKGPGSKLFLYLSRYLCWVIRKNALNVSFTFSITFILSALNYVSIYLLGKRRSWARRKRDIQGWAPQLILMGPCPEPQSSLAHTVSKRWLCWRWCIIPRALCSGKLTLYGQLLATGCRKDYTAVLFSHNNTAPATQPRTKHSLSSILWWWSEFASHFWNFPLERWPLLI